jgi:hypothetical protein
MLCSVCAGVLSEYISLLICEAPSESVSAAWAGRDGNAYGKAEAGCGKIRGEIVHKLTPGGAKPRQSPGKAPLLQVSGD